MAKKVKKAVKKTIKKIFPSKKSVFKTIEKKEHEINWKIIGKIAGFSFIAYILIVSIINYNMVMSNGFLWLLINSIKTTMLVVAVIIFIVGLIAVSENTAR